MRAPTQHPAETYGLAAAVHASAADVGTDCALGEVLNIEVPPGLETVQLQVLAKHALTGDDLIGTATISLEALQVRETVWGHTTHMGAAQSHTAHSAAHRHPESACSSSQGTSHGVEPPLIAVEGSML